MLFMALPTLIVHEIDAWSPFAPPRDATRSLRSMSDYEFPSVLQRSADAAAGSRTAAICEMCEFV